MSAELSALGQGIVSGDRRALARAITLVESNRAEDAEPALALLAELFPQQRRGMRVGISGPPGVGKSSLLERLGMQLVAEGRRPAVLVVDPSSQRGGGSILGDKTRMLELGRQSSAYVRPSPSGEQSGGIARATGDVLLLCDVAGYDPLFVETVGVGQAESAVTSVVDVLLLLLEPGAGDELQGLKRGLTEWGDVIAVNKTDGPRAELAGRTATEFAAALSARRSTAEPPPSVLTLSALENVGIDRLWSELSHRYAALAASGQLEHRRQAQRRAEFRRRLHGELWRAFTGDAARANELEELERRVAAGELLAGRAVRTTIERFFGTLEPP
ncbi:MAG: methylmalonyl Co-A mutase-associated GTPase MeaB [Deltaproteobacteria bacterium]